MKQSELISSIERGIAFLAHEQQSNGSFSCLVSSRLDDYEEVATVPAIVPTNIVLSSLIQVEEGDIVHEIKRRAAEFLLREKNEYWSFNYWFRQSEWYVKEPYPDDLDDTFCALAALYAYDASLFDGEAIAKIATMLTSAEKQEGGPYDMWLVPPEGRTKWNDTDVVVNSNIAYFLSLQGIQLPNVTRFIETAIEERRYEFPYNTIYPGIYFISRFYTGEKKSQMIDLLISTQEPDGKWENPLRTALAMTALLNTSKDRYRDAVERGMIYLLHSQVSDGSWPVASFYYQMKTPEKTLFAGSVSTTTALCLEALQGFRSLNQAPEFREPQQSSEQIIMERIRTVVMHRFSQCGPDLQREAARMMSELLQGNLERQIMLLPFLFREAVGERGVCISDEMVIQLGAANVFGWMAYTAYDDLLDGEGDPRLISPAHVCLRTSYELFCTLLPQESGFSHLTREIFDLIDSANSWELAQTRTHVGPIPEYGDLMHLAHRSLGHALGPLTILFALGFREEMGEIRLIRNFFEHFLIARQLDDDAHDWQEDLEHGQMNVVATWIAHEQGLSLEQVIASSKEALRQIFWEQTVNTVCGKIEEHLEKARSSLEHISVIDHPEKLLQLLIPIQNSVQKTLADREEAMKFFLTYRSSSLE